MIRHSFTVMVVKKQQLELPTTIHFYCYQNLLFTLNVLISSLSIKHGVITENVTQNSLTNNKIRKKQN